ncbi:MAG: DUF2156 domain-containing protein [Methanomicrobiales archaeon]|nr:DUF2156 domain-containing protein [Methanomicrobiales archaeon]
MKLYEDDFHPITLEDKKIFDRTYQLNPIKHSENTFATLYCWRKYGHYSICEHDKSLIIKGETENYRSYRFPLGPVNYDIIQATINLALDLGENAPLIILEPWQYEWMKQNRPDLTLKPDRDFFDYVYRTDVLSSLPGQNYLTIRKHLNKFRKKCPSTIEHISDSNMDDVLEFLIKWCQHRECDKYTILKHEKEAIREAVSNFHEIGLSGITVNPKGVIGAISIFEELNPSTAVVHYEKALPDCEGIYKEINLQTALYLQNKYHYINRESDTGIPGLRESKERYHPDHMVKLYYLDICSN